jgi:hypothetical protein
MIVAEWGHPKFNRQMRERSPGEATLGLSTRAPGSEPSRSLWNWAPLLVLVVAGLLVCALVSLRPRDPQRLVAIFPPWWSLAQSLTAAARVASVSGFGALPFIVAVGGARANLEADLRSAGALIVIDGTGFAFCSSPIKGN